MNEGGDLSSKDVRVFGAPHSHSHPQNIFSFHNQRGYLSSNTKYYKSHISVTDIFPNSNEGFAIPAPIRPNPFPIGNANLLYSQGGNGGGNGSGSAAASFPSHLPPQQTLRESKEQVSKKKRGRPRRYGNDLPESPKISKKLERAAKKAQMTALGSAGRGFTTHIVQIATGEDVFEKLLAFSQHGPGVVCVLSAKGAIANVTLNKRIFEGPYEIHSLSGSFLSTEVGEKPVGGLSVCFAGPDGIIMGGAVPDCLMAASTVQVVVGTFVVDDIKNIARDVNGEISTGTMSAPIPELPPPRAALQSKTEAFGNSRAGLKGDSDKNTDSHSFAQQIQVLNIMPSRPMDRIQAKSEAQMRRNAESTMAGGADIKDHKNGYQYEVKDKDEDEDEDHTHQSENFDSN